MKYEMENPMKAVIFDMDGVLIDSEPEYLNFSLQFAQSKNPNVTITDLYGMLGSSGKDAWSTMERAVNNGQSWEELRLEFRSTIDVYSLMDYRKIFRQESIPVLDYIKEQGLPIALASSTQMDIIERVLDENGIRHYFSVVASGKQFQRSKPDPEIYLYTASQLGVSTSECLVIEDSTFGIQAAHSAGMPVIAVKNVQFAIDQSLADWCIDSLTEIPAILDTV